MVCRERLARTMGRLETAVLSCFWYGKSAEHLTLSYDLSPLDAAVELTAQRDLDTLAAAMVRTVSTLQRGFSVCVYSLQGDLGNLSAKVVACSDMARVGTYLTALENRPLLRRCIDRQEMVEAHVDGGCKRVYPVIEQDQVTGLVSCETNAEADDSCQVVEKLVAIYANLHSLLNHQQRDGLTGLFNRAALDSWLAKALAPAEIAGRRAVDSATLGCFAIFDIDHFKRINDSLGHLYGDEVLLILAELMRESFRFNDMLFRYGGEEFIAVLTDTDLDTAMAVLERFRARVASHHFPQINQVTLTIGVAEIEPQVLPSTLIDRADKALYYGKNHGRNQVNAYEWLNDGRVLQEAPGGLQTIELF
ncbi:MAG TPA: GGDEF domain-containing protein [Gammaproteobacteria bacterium]|nr:GGDEF domain-containing protein [Gammaproteobacteria bacterium]